MKSYSGTAAGIAFKIWSIAILCNTIIGTIVLSDNVTDAINFILIGAIFGAIFSFPVFFILWVLLFSLLKKKFSAIYILRVILICGIIMALVSWGTFSNGFSGGGFLQEPFAIVPLVSAIISIVISYRSIKNICIKRDEEDVEIVLLNRADTEIE